MIYDVAIIGLGPAGATLARLLSPNLKVLAIDRKSGPGQEGFQKCCGGLLANDAQKALAKFGLTLPLNVLVNPQVFAVRTIDIHVKEERFYQRFYLNMDRHAFDLWLVSLIPEHVTIADRSICFDIRREDGLFRIRTRRDGEEQEHLAKTVIGADGANSVVRRTFYQTKKIRRYLARQEWYRAPARKPFYAAIFDKDVTDSYGWALCKDHALIVGAAIPEDRANERFSRFKEGLVSRGFILDKCVKREACYVYSPNTPMCFCPGKNGALLVGEAAGFISPSSLEGISYAMDTATILAKVLNKNTGGVEKRYAHALLPLKIKLWGKMLKMPFLYNPLLRKWILRTGISSIAMVE